MTVMVQMLRAMGDNYCKFPRSGHILGALHLIALSFNALTSVMQALLFPHSQGRTLRPGQG